MKTTRLLPPLLSVAMLGACSSGGSSDMSSADQSGADATGQSASQASGQMRDVSVILDWTPNTNHTGLFVAQEKGYFADAGLNVDIMGFSKSGVDAVLSAGGADFGISGADALASAHAANLGLTMVLNIQQKSSYGVGVLEDSGITRPKDLDGKTIADYSGDSAHISTQMMIQHDGGTGEFDRVIVGAQAMAALESGQADFAEVLSTWEAIEAELSGTKLHMFQPADYDVPTTPAMIGISTRNDLIESDPDLVRAFVQAAQKGYEFAKDNPDEAAKILVDANPQAKLDPELVTRSQEILSTQYWPDSKGGVGFADIDRWNTYLAFIVEQGLVYDEKGTAVTEPIAADDIVTNEFVK